MTEQRGDPGLVAEENLAGHAHRLGQQHRSATGLIHLGDLRRSAAARGSGRQLGTVE